MMKKMNSFSQAEAATDAANSKSIGGGGSSKSSGGKLSKSLSKSSSISTSKDDPKQDSAEKEETPEEKFKKFEGDGVTFKAKLVGSELVMEPRGDKMCQNSIQRLKAIIKGQKVHKQRIVMKISYQGVKVYDEKSNEILHHHEVPQISFIASDDSDARTFGYVCDVPNKAHQFICFKTNGPALQVMSIISSLFEAVLEKKKQAGESTPSKAPTTSTPTSAKSQQANGSNSNNNNNNASQIKSSSSPFDDDFGKDITTSGDIKNAMDTSDLISSTEVSQSNNNNNNELGQANQSSSSGGGGGNHEKTQESSGTNVEGTIRSTGSKKDIRSYFDDLKDLQISKIDHTPPFHLIHSGVGGGDSGIMDSTTFSDWGATSTLSQSGGMSRTNSAAQMSRQNSGTVAGLSRTNSAGGGLLFEANAYGSQAPPAAHPPSSLFYQATPTSSATTTPMSPMTPFGVSPPDHFAKPQQPALASQAMFIPQRQVQGGGGGPFGQQQQQQPTPSMMVPNHHHQHHHQQQHQQQQHQVGPNAASFGAFFEPPSHSNMIVGSAPMNQLSHHQMSQHARFSSSMVAGLHQRLGSSAASIQSTGSAGVLSRPSNPFDDEFFA